MYNKIIKRIICLLLVFFTVFGTAVIPAEAVEDPMVSKDYDQFGTAPAEEQQPEPELTETAEPEPEETIPEETEPVQQETVPEEAVPEETVPEETVEESIPEELPGEEAPEDEEVMEESAAEEEADRKVSSHPDMPLYFQTDYPNELFADSTIAKSGCSVTALAMVATYMTGHDYRPDDLARYFGGVAENNIERLEKGSEILGLTFRKAENWHKARAAIQEGKVAIVLLGRKSAFTDSQHFIVVTGVNEEGKYLVNDPYEPNYDVWCLKEGFEKGFEESLIVTGYSGAWIYDKDAMPEKVPFYSEPDIDRSNPRYPDICLTDEEKMLLARVIWVEARGESAEGQQAVAEVILNRMASDKFSDTLRGVIYGEGQFLSVEHLKDAIPWQAQYDALERALYGPYILPEDVYHFATFQTNEKVWGVIGGHIFCYAAD